MEYIIIALVGLAVVYALFSENKEKSAPVKKTKAKTSNAAATINAKLAIAGDSNPAEAKNFWNWANLSLPTQRNKLPPIILSTILKSQNIDQ